MICWIWLVLHRGGRCAHRVEALNAIVGDIACAAEHLHRAIGHATARLSGEQFRGGGEQGDILTRIAATGSVHDHALGRIGLGLAVGDHRLDQLVFHDRLAELLALQRIVHHLADQALGHTRCHGGDVQASFIQHAHRNLEALALLADHVGCRHAALSKITSQIWAPCWPIFFSGTRRRRQVCSARPRRLKRLSRRACRGRCGP